jgi:hypothetical protein
VGDIVRSYRKKKVGEKERHGNFEEGTKKVTAITESLGQKFYKLDNERREYIRADVRLIRKGPGKKPQENFDEDEANADVEARRKINIDEEERTEEIDPEEEQKKLKRMNKTDRAKYLAKREPKPGPDLSGALGGRASGSGMFGRPI